MIYNRIQLTGLISLTEGQNAEEFEDKLMSWIEDNGWVYHPDSVDLPDGFSFRRTFHAALFHSNTNEPRRYVLEKIWNPMAPIAGALLMNPSAADEWSFDETIKFLVHYLQSPHHEIRYGGLIVINTSPIVLGNGTRSEHFPDDAFNWTCIETIFHKHEQ